MTVYLVYSVTPKNYLVYQSFLKQTNLDFAPIKLQSLGALLFDVCDIQHVDACVEFLSNLCPSQKFVYVPFVCNTIAGCNLKLYEQNKKKLEK